MLTGLEVFALCYALSLMGIKEYFKPTGSAAKQQRPVAPAKAKKRARHTAPPTAAELAVDTAERIGELLPDEEQSDASDAGEESWQNPCSCPLPACTSTLRMRLFAVRTWLQQPACNSMIRQMVS
jgi:hypothetical protein